MDKIFAKPLVAAIDAHRDAVKCVARAHKYLSQMYSGSCDGEIKFWNLAGKNCIRSIRAHEGFVRGLVSTQDDRFLFSCGDDGLIKQWKIDSNTRIDRLEMEDLEDQGNLATGGDLSTLGSLFPPIATFRSNNRLTSLDHHWTRPLLSATSDFVQIWDVNRGSVLHTFEWGVDTVVASRFNPSQDNILAASSSDNSISFFDIRDSSGLRKVVLKNRTNALCWNPQQPVALACANEDGNIYTFDMRKLKEALHVHKDFVNAVLDVDFSPDGRELVGGSFDGTVRMWNANETRSRDVYHTKRMGRVLATKYTADTRYIVSGSEDGNLRVWKRVAAESVGPRTTREQAAIDYRNALKDRYQHLPEIKRIARHHHVPKLIKSLTEKKKIMGDAEKQKRARAEQHGSKGLPLQKEAVKAIRSHKH
eukprot:GDKJ01048490.1.p1 GENE.GDKJ01048490.1~~GDKJ01048490.1.p1  ORF type:complete len:473 (-),score=103.16 GDKJ01048490.1:164-1423(-)